MPADPSWRVAAQYENAWQVKDDGQYEFRRRLYILACPRKHILVFSTPGMTIGELGGVFLCQECDRQYSLPS